MLLHHCYVLSCNHKVGTPSDLQTSPKSLNELRPVVGFALVQLGSLLCQEPWGEGREQGRVECGCKNRQGVQGLGQRDHAKALSGTQYGGLIMKTD